MDKLITMGSGLHPVDADMVRYLFRLKALSLEKSEGSVGIMSTQDRIINTAEKIVSYMNEKSQKDTYFYIFLGDATTRNLKLVCGFVENETERTNHIAIRIHASWLDFSVDQLSLSGKMLTHIRGK